MASRAQVEPSAELFDGNHWLTVPVVIGTGRRLFGGRPQTKTWTLASARSFPSGLVQAHYDRKR